MNRDEWNVNFTAIWLVVIFLFRPDGSFGQGERLSASKAREAIVPGREIVAKRWTALTTRDGLSQSSVNCIFRDSYGFMWFGTQDGLNRYDGYTFSVYRHDPLNPASIPDNQIKCLFEDELHRLWIGTLGGGLCVYDRNRDSFLRLEDLGIHPDFQIEPAILSFHEDRHGGLWVGTYRGLLWIDRHAKKIRQFQVSPGNGALSDATIQSIFEDDKGRIWLGTNNGLNLYHPKTQTFTHWVHDDRDPHSLSSNTIMAITEEASGQLCIATDGGGLNVFNPVTNHFTAYRPNAAEASISSLSVRTLCPSADGHVWVGTENGLDLFEETQGSFIHYRHTLIGEGSLSNNTVLSLLEDRNGILWAGTAQGGVNKYDRNLFYFDVYRSTSDPASLSGDQVTSFTEDNSGDIWIGTDGAGLNQWQASTGRYIHYYPQSGNSQSLGGGAILSLLASRDKHTLWIGTYGYGLDKFDLRTHRWEHYHAGAGPGTLSNPSIYTLLEDRAGDLWMGTNGGGIDVLHPDGSITKHRFTGARDSVSNNYIRCLMEDHDGQIWVGTYSGGISVYNPGTKKFTVYDNVVHHLSNQVVFSLCEDSKGRIWAGTMGGGLDLFDPVKKRFTVFNEVRGLSNNIVNSIIEDKSGYLWLSTNKGISRLNPATGEFRNFGIYNGLQNLEFTVGAGFRDSRGRIFFGGISGFNVFDPKEETRNNVPPQPRLTGFFLFNKPVRPGEPGSPLKGDINQAEELVLSHDQSDFSIGYAALNYTVAAEDRYAYKLEGFDKDWNMVGAQRQATYTNLPPGRYLFRVKAANNDGLWSKKDTVLAIRVRPPFWATWWAYALYVVLLLTILYIIYRDLRERERLKSRIRLEQMTAEKTKELNDIKLNFFTSVSHELRTPLSLITDPLRRLISGDVTPEQTRRYSRLMYDNAMRLTRLINQMLDWRKLETGHLKADLRLVNIVSLTKNIAGLFEVHAVERSITYTVEAASEEIEAPLDTDKFEKIVFNLISNAFKYTPDNGTITISLRRGLLQGVIPCVELHVKDTGIGIAPQLRDKVFDLFYQVEGSARYESAATGIGLALARELAGLHNGRLEVVSEEGAGSDFILYLPLSQESMVMPGDPASGSIVTEVSGKEASGEDAARWGDAEPGKDQALKEEGSAGEAAQPEEELPLILLVEDNNDLREYIKNEMGPGYRTEVAADGARGLEKALQLVPDLIISDIMMPGISGLELCRQVKTDERTSHIPVILLTARQSDAHQVEGYTAGADIYIPKPFNMEVVIACVNSLLESRRRLRALYERSLDVAAGSDGDAGTVGKAGADATGGGMNKLDQLFLEKAVLLVEKHLADPLFDVDVLAAGLKVSRRQLYRKLKALIDETPHDLITGRRLQAAAILLRGGEYSVSEVAYKVGYSEPANFTRSFTRAFGMSPSKYKTG
jgi:ligand-binding sensor domain-containing protein/signal transduction histidine kinase/AraC-like DNA-binding protein/ActR/RegA family two-component response regulator